MTATGTASTAADGLPPELVARFAEALRRLNPHGGKIGLAVSGGPDSMAMLLLAHAAIPGSFEVATVDHGLRPEAKDECALVAAACAVRDIPCEVLRVEVAKGNVQAKAREARYDALGAWATRRKLACIATAHHADDQAETLLMRLNRGSGVAGLAGVRALSQISGVGVPVIRPVLDFRRAELRALVEGAGVAFASDPSNQDDSYDRVRIRKALADADWLDPRALARSAGHLAEANAALVNIADAYFCDHASSDGTALRLLPPDERMIALLALGRALSSFGAEARGSEIAGLLGRLEAGEGGNLAGVLVTVEKDEWVFRPEPPRRTG